jgi:hypothetical protein
VTAGFEDRAADWTRFARTEGHDAYRRYRDAFLELLLPRPARALEIGCGADPTPPGPDVHRRSRIPLFLLWRATNRGGRA